MKNVSLLLVVLVFLAGCISETESNSSKKETKSVMQKEESVEIKHNEEKTYFDSLKIKFTGFGHEHSASSPNEGFSATTGVYNFNIRENENEIQVTIYTDAQGRSNPEKIFDKYEMTLEKASADQKTLTMRLVRTQK